MREILFRGKTYTGKWIEGFLFQEVGDCVVHWCISSSPLWANDYSEINGDYSEVIPETVGQYTGSTKNGKKIFEGDIGKNIDGVFLVCWDKEKCAFVMRFLEYPYETLYLEEMWDDSEVIGNIHDNPELLKGGAE